MRHYTVYKTTNLLTGVIYIGKHECHEKCSWVRKGKCTYLGSGDIIQLAIKKYGRENFSNEILYSFDNEEEMNAKEAELVTEELIATGTVYNLCPGGQGGWGYVNTNKLNDRTGMIHTEEAKRKFSRIGSMHTPETKAKIGAKSRERKATVAAIEANRGRPRSEETKRKLSLANKKSYKKVETQVKCPHCNKDGYLIGMKRWHFDNCKQRKL